MENKREKDDHTKAYLGGGVVSKRIWLVEDRVLCGEKIGTLLANMEHHRPNCKRGRWRRGGPQLDGGFQKRGEHPLDHQERLGKKLKRTMGGGGNKVFQV